MFVKRVIMEHLARGDRLVITSTGAGKTRAAVAWASLATTLELRKAIESFHEVLTHSAVPSTALLSTSEADNKLPTITSGLVQSDASQQINLTGLGSFDLIEELRLFLDAIDLSIQQLVRVVESFLGIRHFDATGPAPPHAMSPCGVIRFAAPRIPRAPGCDRSMPITTNYHAPAA
ncbi:hypothetical protein STRTUCAR8_03696 [Streptomyces turgidiscabies Car8]|uniref:Uncharacterized protein n=2 Tax=Streptomyces TaxID=1883 RepID=L7ET14_STRT8|nr:hypothetical protein STRTUCAR8_03696 [Streptomyces turgidiscabies Car8]